MVDYTPKIVYSWLLDYLAIYISPAVILVHHTATVTLLLLCCYCYTGTVTLLPLHCYCYTATVTLLPLCCHCYTGTVVLSLQLIDIVLPYMEQEKAPATYMLFLLKYVHGYNNSIIVDVVGVTVEPLIQEGQQRMLF